MSEWRETNRAWQDERVPVQLSSRFYDIDGVLAGAGLRIEWRHEHPFTDRPFLEREGRVFESPGDVPSRPLMDALLATAPA